MVVVIFLDVYGNDYKSRIDSHNFFIYHPVAPEMEQRKELIKLMGVQVQQYCVPLYVSYDGESLATWSLAGC